MHRILSPIFLLVAVVTGRSAAQDAPSLDAIVAALPQWGRPILGPDAPEQKFRSAALQQMRASANARDREAWAHVDSKDSWEKFRDAKVALLKRSLGSWPEGPQQPTTVTTRTIDGDGFRIENLVYGIRPGLVVTANLYVPDPPRKAMPGIVIIHSHHNPKTQGELQDMGMTWARAGCLVLVPDQLGHGERRQHPFVNEKSYPAPFKVGRQDYYFRYNLGVQLQLVGESLPGWMVWDLMRGIDVLLARPGIDRHKIIVLGSVAGGGDPAAVLAALDPRVAAVVPFNFGGAQPETKFPLPKDAELTFNYMGGGSWESTRNLRLSARDGFLPWLIVAAAAPRPLIYAHEFAWDQPRDPVWKRLQKTYNFYEAADHLASVHGRGAVTGKPPEATHCNNIGAEHRKGIHPAFERWFGIEAHEYQKRLPSEQLQCLTAEAKMLLKPRPLHVLADEVAGKRLEDARARRAGLSPDERRAALQKDWWSLLGLETRQGAKMHTVETGRPWLGDARFISAVIRHPEEPNLAVPLVWLQPASAKKDMPVVVGIAQGGKAGFMEHRAETIARLLQAGVSVCLPDLRGAGEMHPAKAGRGRTSGDTGISATEWMHGRTVLGRQVQELLLVLDALRAQGTGPAVLWGDSFAPVNAADANLAVPYDADRQPELGEPMGGLVALLAGLLAPEGSVAAIESCGSLASYRSVLADPFFYLPHDSLVPGVLAACDIDDVASAWAPRPLRIEAPIDARNRRIAGKELHQALSAAAKAYGEKGLELRETRANAEEAARWLTAAARRGAGR
jgi:dienelactone hydrolase